MSPFWFFTITPMDIVDILTVAVIIYQLYRMTRGTAAMRIFVGVAVIYAVWLGVRALRMELTGGLLGQIMGVGILALIIVFQQEIRRFLLVVGGKYMAGQAPFLQLVLGRSQGGGYHQQSHRELVEACMQLSRDSTGALIALSRTSPLQPYINTGVVLDARVNARLLENIFFKNSPLHDGAVIIRTGRIVAAQCILPVTDNPTIEKRLGLRHRAALGLSEKTDAVLLVVSEETGAVSLVADSSIHENLSRPQLEALLSKSMKGADSPKRSSRIEETSSTPLK